MKTNLKKTISYCFACSMRHIGLCPALIKVLSEQLNAFSPPKLSLPAKQYLYKQGEQCQGSYILKDGWILLSRTTDDGIRQVLRPILPGDIMGFQPEMEGVHSDSAKALKNSVVCVIPDLKKICSTHAELAMRLAWIAACENTLTEVYLANIAHKSARERIAFMVLELFLRLKSRKLNRTYTIPFPLLQEDIADMLGLTTVHVNRTLKALRKDKVLMIEKHELTILDYNALYSLAGSQLNALINCDIAAA